MKEKNAVYHLQISALVLGQFAAQTWKANSSTGHIPTAIKSLVPMATHSFPDPLDFNMLVIFSSKNV